MCAAKQLIPSYWASLAPFGVGHQRPNNYLEIWKAFVESRDQLPYAWRILNEGVCDGCALGTSGLKDWTLHGPHLCNVRLRLLRLNTMPALDVALLSDLDALTDAVTRRQEDKKTRRQDVQSTSPDHPITVSSGALRDLGRLPYPMLRQRGDAGFRRVSWDAALDAIAAKICATTPERIGFYLTSRGMPNEAYYAAQKAVRAMGTNSVDNAARICHSPSTVALKAGLGVGATTCSYSDWIGSDLIVFVGANPANNQPVTTKYLHYAKKAGTKVVMVNSYREPGMERYWVPSVPESALFGTKIADEFFMVNIGGDIAFLNGVLKHLIANGWVDVDFIATHTTGFQELAADLARQPWPELERQAGVTRAEMLQFAALIRDAKTAVLVWSMGVTQHVHGEDGVRAIVNLALTKGFVGRDKCGVMPIRGHSGVQGGAEMGAYATVFPGGVPISAQGAQELEALWGFAVPTIPGMTAPEMIDAAHAGALDVLFSVGGNFLEVLPEPDQVKAALERVPLRVHMDIVLSSQMLLDPADTVVLLPATTRYEVPGGVTETSTERRVIFSPEIAGPRIGEARSEIEVFMDLARRVRPDRAAQLHFSGTAAVRAEIARAIPQYAGIEQLAKQGDQFQYGGAHLCADWQFPTTDGKAHFTIAPLPQNDLPAGMFRVTTRRGKQFNSMVHEQRDAITGAARDAVFMCAADAQQLGLRDGDAVTLRNAIGVYSGRVFVAPVTPRNLQIHWPEGNVIIRRDRRSPIAGIPDYNALVRVEAG